MYSYSFNVYNTNLQLSFYCLQYKCTAILLMFQSRTTITTDCIYLDIEYVLFSIIWYLLTYLYLQTILDIKVILKKKLS